MDAVPPGALVLRPMKAEDVGPLGRLAQEQGRNLLAHDYERFLALEGARGYVVERDGALLGCVTAMRYFEHAFLGPVLLAGHDDAVGVTIALFAQTIETLQREGIDVIETEAGAVEEAILGRMGFETARRTVVFERPAAEAATARGASSPDAHAPEATARMETAHLLDVGAMDAAAVGYGRKGYLLALRAELPEGARVALAEGELAGFALLRRGARGYHLGPLVTRAGDVATARALLRDVLRAVPEGPVVVLAPEGTPFLLTLEQEGFRAVGALARMSAGTRAAPAAAAQDATQWALGGRITG